MRYLLTMMLWATAICLTSCDLAGSSNEESRDELDRCLGFCPDYTSIPDRSGIWSGSGTSAVLVTVSLTLDLSQSSRWISGSYRCKRGDYESVGSVEGSASLFDISLFLSGRDTTCVDSLSVYALKCGGEDSLCVRSIYGADCAGLHPDDQWLSDLFPVVLTRQEE